MKLNEALKNKIDYSFLPKYDGGKRQASADFRGNKPPILKMKIPAGVSAHGVTELMDLGDFTSKDSFMKYYKVIKSQGGEIRTID